MKESSKHDHLFFSDQEVLASTIQSFLSLDRVETVHNRFGELSDSDDDDFVMFQPPVEVVFVLGLLYSLN